jgi:hypothetical protein
MAGRLFAQDFEQKTGLQGIAGYYTMPYQMKMSEADIFLQNLGETDNDTLQKFAADLLELNPDLKTVRYNDNQLFHFLRGATSGFNPRDIDFYLNDRPEEPPTEEVFRLENTNDTITDNHPYAEGFKHLVYWQAINTKIGTNIHWTASYETFDRIKEQLGLEEWIPNEQEWKQAQTEAINQFYGDRGFTDLHSRHSVSLPAQATKQFETARAGKTKTLPFSFDQS